MVLKCLVILAAIFSSVGIASAQGANQKSQQSAARSPIQWAVYLESHPPQMPHWGKVANPSRKVQVTRIRAIKLGYKDPRNPKMRVSHFSFPVSNTDGKHNRSGKVKIYGYRANGQLVNTPHILGQGFGFMAPNSSTWEYKLAAGDWKRIHILASASGITKFCIRGKYIPHRCTS